MTTNDELWAEALQEVMAERREELAARLAEDSRLQAFLAGELTADEADEVRELLAAYPETAVALENPNEPPRVGPGHPARLSAAEQELGWAKLGARLGIMARSPGGRWRWKLWVPMAAGLAVVALGIHLQLRSPTIEVAQHLRPDVRPRGLEPGESSARLEPRAEAFTLILELPVRTQPRDRFAVKLNPSGGVADPPAWSVEDRASEAGDVLTVTIPRRVLPAGHHQLRVERPSLPGVPGEVVATYSFGIP